MTASRKHNLQRFFSPTPLGIDMRLEDSEQIHQITRVLRLGVGDAVIFFDGDGSQTIYTIEQVEKRSLILRGKERIFPRGYEPTRSITLYQALPNKHEKIEWMIQKSVEVGIKKVVFFRSDRSQKLLISEAKKERYAHIAREALEQCGGLVPLEIVWAERYAEDMIPTTQTNYVLHTSARSMRL